MRHLRSKVSILLVTGCALMLYSYYTPEPDFNEQVNQYYSERLLAMKKEIAKLRSMAAGNKTEEALKKQFIKSRYSYKKVAVLLEYFNGYEVKVLNGPNLQRIESETPDNIIQPSGFQVIEDKLYSSPKPDVIAIQDQALIMQQSIERIENEPDRKFKFKKELVFGSIRSALIAIMDLGITGFDSPVALHSIPEATESFEGINLLIRFFKPDIDRLQTGLYTRIANLVSTSIQYLNTHSSFDKFDRLDFIQRYINPLASLLTSTGKKLGLVGLRKNGPVDDTSQTIFSKDAFNPNFFSPGAPYEMTAKRIALGRMLFNDPILSGDLKKSCNSCHKPEKAFTDGLKTALSVNDTAYLTRNTPTLLNSVFQTKLFWDSRTSLLENQLDEVVHNEKEMRGSLKQSVSRLKDDSVYVDLFNKAYPEEKDPIIEFNIANAISNYVRSLITFNSRFDRYMRGEKTALNAAEKNGFNLFAGKAKCATCHFIPLFNSLVPPAFIETESEVLGVPQTKDKRNPVLDPDLGRYGFTTSVIHKYAFKTPTLRNIQLTAPYMHNGVFTTLEEVMEFYNNGGGKGLKIAPENQTLPFDKLKLSAKEMADIIKFMKTLTDTQVQYTSRYIN